MIRANHLSYVCAAIHHLIDHYPELSLVWGWMLCEEGRALTAPSDLLQASPRKPRVLVGRGACSQYSCTSHHAVPCGLFPAELSRTKSSWEPTRESKFTGLFCEDTLVRY
ncbi:unnamed protein product [Rangifer tarandus platyrhynchus]|uniref:Uncharacterized protein n=1 Tax=Rangifer tarandus platyrhynchus TaxID=3082113 RepID=A0AC59Y753_RANTA